LSVQTEWRLRASTRGLFASLLAIYPQIASAQSALTLDDANLVLSRVREGYDAQGIALGGFRAFPRVDASAAYDDNIYATANRKVSSPMLMLSPELRLVSQWSRHALVLAGSGTFERYTDRRTENNNRYRLTAIGRMDLRDFAAVNFEGHYLKSIEARGTAGDIVIAGEPIRYFESGGTAGITGSLSRISASLSGDYNRFRYWDARVGNAVISQSYRNRQYYAGTFRLSYDLTPAVKPFVEVRREAERYYQRDRNTSFDSKGTIALAGFRVDLTQLLSGRAAVGYRWRNYRNPLYRSTSGLSYDLDLIWNPRTLLSIRVGASKSIDESPSPISSGIIRNTVSLTIDYELLRNLLLGVSAAHTNERFRGMDRTDRRIVAAAGARYLLNRFAQVSARYTRTSQDGSGIFGRTYDDNTVGITLTLQR
jgi:hypothetical protein